MKLATALFALVTIAFGFQAQAAEPYSTCSNGTNEQVGDGLFQLEIMNDGSLVLKPYEGGYAVKANDYSYDTDSRTLTIVNKTLVGSVQGKKNSVVVDAMFVPSTAGKINAAISYDKGEFQSYSLTCK